MPQVDVAHANLVLCVQRSLHTKYLIGKPCCYSCFRYLPPPCAWRQVLLLLLPRFDGCWLVGWHSLWCKKRKRPRSISLAAPRKMVIASSPNGATRCDPVERAWQGSKGLHWEISPLSTCCFQQLLGHSIYAKLWHSTRLFYPPSG